MNQDIIKMAREAELYPTSYINGRWEATDEQLERFFRMAQADMKEKCAVICDKMVNACIKVGYEELAAIPKDCADAIRAIGDKS